MPRNRLKNPAPPRQGPLSGTRAVRSANIIDRMAAPVVTAFGGGNFCCTVLCGSGAVCRTPVRQAYFCLYPGGDGSPILSNRGDFAVWRTGRSCVTPTLPLFSRECRRPNRSPSAPVTASPPQNCRGIAVPRRVGELRRMRHPHSHIENNHPQKKTRFTCTCARYIAPNAPSAKQFPTTWRYGASLLKSVSIFPRAVSSLQNSIPIPGETSAGPFK